MDEESNEMIRIFIVEEVGIQVDKATILYAIGQKEEALSLLKTTINIRLANYENIKFNLNLINYTVISPIH